MTAAANPRSVALVVALASFLSMLEGTIIATALPHMAQDFHVRPIDLSAGITAYLLVAAAMLPASSWIAERFGARRVFMLSVLGFAGASLLCGAANGLLAFVAARALQACCSAMMVPVGNLVLLRVAPKRDLVTLLAISSTPALIAPVVGPPIGAFITELVGWRWIFFINLPLAIAGAVAILRIVPDLRREATPRFDGKGFALTAGALSTLVLGLDRLGAHPNAWQIPALLLAAATLLTLAAIRHARRAEHPIIPLGALRHHSFAATAFGGGFLARIPFVGQAVLLPLYFQLGFGMSVIATGLLLLAQNAGDLALKPVAGRVLTWIGFRTAMTAGALVMVISFASYALLSPSLGMPILFVAVFAIGMARSIFFTAMMALAFADVTQEEMAGASVLNSMAFAVSAALGISLAALLVNVAPVLGLSAPGGIAGYRFALLVLAGIAALSVPMLARLAHDVGAEVSGHRVREPVTTL